jgi:putative flippase GtrA
MLGKPKSALEGFCQAAGREPVGGPVSEFLRYGAASAVALAVDFGALVLLTELAGLHYLASAAAGFGLGIVVAYLLSIRWVFASRRLASVPAEGAIFLLIGLAGLIINIFVMYGLTELALLPYAVSKVGSVGLVFTFNFSVRKAVLFTAPALPRG